MPRIRKKTSKRGTTNDKKKVSQKVRETRKKKVRAAKKSTEWKSKHKKDPGIPNTFPYKDQILAEVAEQRKLVAIYHYEDKFGLITAVQAAEEKQRRKDEKKASKPSENAQDVNTEDGDGIASISAKRLMAKTTSKPVPEIEHSETEEDDAPILINRDLPHLQAVLDQADVVVEVLDVRDPLAFRSSYLEEIIRSKINRKTLFVLNKIGTSGLSFTSKHMTTISNSSSKDCAPQEAVSAWITALRKVQPTFPFRSASSFLPGSPLASVDAKGKGKGKAKDPVDDALGANAILECLSKWAEEKKDDTPLTVAVVGVTNAGKSSLLNSLMKTSAFAVYSIASPSRAPTTTTMPQENNLQLEGRSLRFIDTPGFLWKTPATSLVKDDARARDILMRNKGRIDRSKDPLSPVAHLVSRANPEDLMLLYGLPAFPKGDIDAFITGIARSQQLVRKRGVLHLTGASKIVLRDWCTGKIHWYSTPPSDLAASTPPTEAWLEALYAKTDEVLTNLRSRKAMRKAGGLVRISPGQVESREVMSEVSYADSEEFSESDNEDRLDVDEAGSGEDEDEDEVEDDEMEEEEEEEETAGEVGESSSGVEDEVPPPRSRSQKRKRVDSKILLSNKKVTFTARSQFSKDELSTKPAVTSATSTRKSSSTVVSATKKDLKSSLKKAKPVANAPSKVRPLKIAADKGDGESYDFEKYF
ncbi:hypothetical protein F5050DRAFT_1804004 [Lentinula boryana]|uniref:P-loop containing nucleoside triphosphate hydrolase protein n=1 Tax=Lentinula boryana TaxID=40481 RepID=A0ABQ8QPV8_9AGAR|nr:hypothetical protein F5050DRAFT_1804004 [Lentinula boryana]